MDVAAAKVEAGHVKDEVAERCQKKFQDFLDEWRDKGDHPKYLEPSKELVKPDINTLRVSEGHWEEQQHAGWDNHQGVLY